MSPFVIWNSGFFLSCSRGVGPPVKLWLGTRVSPLVVTGNSGFLLSGYSGLRPHLSCRWECRRLRVPVKFQQVIQSSSIVLVGPQSSSQVVAWDTGFDLSLGRELRGPLELGGMFRVHLELQWGLLSTSLGASHFLQGCAWWVPSCCNVWVHTHYFKWSRSTLYSGCVLLSLIVVCKLLSCCIVRFISISRGPPLYV